MFINDPVSVQTTVHSVVFVTQATVEPFFYVAPPNLLFDVNELKANKRGPYWLPAGVISIYKNAP